MTDAVETKFATTGEGGHVAYQAIGDGPIDVLVTRMPLFPIDLMWDEPRLAHFLNRLSSFCRHIWFDTRGIGASDSASRAEGSLLETVLDDMVAVIDDVGCERVTVLCLGVPIGPLFAATYPERTTAIVLVNATARLRRDDDYPQGIPDEAIAQLIEAAHEAGTTHTRFDTLAPSLVDDTRFRRWFQRAERLASPPRSALEVPERVRVRPARRARFGPAPTLVVNRRDRPFSDQTRYLADHIATAKYVEVPGVDTLPFVGDAGAILDAIEEFLTGHLAPPESDRVLATVLFTDLVDSTPQAAQMGDRRWRELLDDSRCTDPGGG